MTAEVAVETSTGWLHVLPWSDDDITKTPSIVLTVAQRSPVTGSTAIEGNMFASWTFLGSCNATDESQCLPPSVERDTTTLLPVKRRPFVTVSPHTKIAYTSPV